MSDWRGRALCRPGGGYPPDLWFPVGTSGPALIQIGEAKAVCRRCPVVSECLVYALGRCVEGVWAATTEEERRALKRRNKTATVPVVALCSKDLHPMVGQNVHISSQGKVVCRECDRIRHRKTRPAGRVRAG